MSDYLTTTEAGERIGMSANYIARQCANGSLKAKKLGTEWRISNLALEQFMGADAPTPPARKRLSARQMRRAS